MNKQRIAIVEGVRTPFNRSWGVFWDLLASDLAAQTFKALIAKTGLDPRHIDDVILGNIAPPQNGGCSARIALKHAGFPDAIPGHTTNRNCGSGMQAITEAMDMIRTGRARIVLAGGAESMSNASQYMYTTKASQQYWGARERAKRWQRPLVEWKFRNRETQPTSGLELGLHDPICGLNTGQGAAMLVNDFVIPRKEQDEFAYLSHSRAAAATKSGAFSQEIIPIFLPPTYAQVSLEDDGIRDYGSKETALKKLAGLKLVREFLLPGYDPMFSTVTAGNSSQITDGAAAVLVMREDVARAMGYTPLGYVVGASFVGCEPSRFGMGPVFAMWDVLTQTGMTISDMGLVEINEAFAAQVIACERALASRKYLDAHLPAGSNRIYGELDRNILNVNGGAIALGHPVGASGARIVLTILKEMQRRSVEFGIASICIGGGQGGAMIVQRGS